MTDPAWGTNGPMSLPKALDSTDVSMVDFEGFCFTPDGLRLNLSKAEREDLLANTFKPDRGQFSGQG